MFLPANVVAVQRTPNGSLKLAAEEKSELILARLAGHSTDVPYAYRLDPASLLKLPQVYAITVIPAKRFERRIVHVLNFCMPPLKYAFSEEEKKSIPEAKRRRIYRTWLDEDKAVDKEQEQLLAKMIEMCDVRGVYLEGVSTDMGHFLRKLKNDPERRMWKEMRKAFEKSGAACRLFLSGAGRNHSCGRARFYLQSFG